MPQAWCCPRGHRWDWEPSGKSARKKKRPRCPMCGAEGTPAQPIAAVAVASDGGAAPSDTLSLPPALAEKTTAPSAATPPLAQANDETLPGTSASGPARNPVAQVATGDDTATLRMTSPPPGSSPAQPASTSTPDVTLTGDSKAPAPFESDATLAGSSARAMTSAPIAADSVAPNRPTRKGEAPAVAPEIEGISGLVAPSTGPGPLTSSDATRADPRSQKSLPSAPPSPAQTGSDAATLVESKSQVAPGDRQPAAASGDSGGYDVLGTLGRGGMGVVYKARQRGLNRLVALKMILSGTHASAEDIDRFQAEAKAVAELQHQNIVQIYDWGERDGHPYFALEFVDGGTLQARINGQPMAARAAAELVEKLARGMAFAHGHGILHRDLKPANVLVTKDGTPKITDFGLAKKLGDDSGRTGTGAILGTPSYMAPEQAEGKKEIGPAADIYSLGAILYDALTGRPPFCGESVLDTLSQVKHDDPVPPSRLQPRVPRDLEIICLKCLQKEPGKRYSTADELADDLHRFLHNEPIKARAVSMLERVLKWARRRPAVAALLALLAITLVGGFLGFFTLWRLAEGARGDAERARKFAEEEREVARKAEKEADAARATAQERLDETKRTLYASQMKLALEAWNEAKDKRLRELLAAQDPKVHGGADLRGFEWFFLWNLLRSDRLALKAHTVALRAVAFRPPAGQQLATASGNGSIILWDVGPRAPEVKATQNYRIFTGHSAGVRGLAFSSDGSVLVSGGEDGRVVVWDPERPEKPLATFAGHAHAVTCVAVSPDGKRLASGSEDRTIKIWDRDTGKEIATLRGHLYAVQDLVFSKDSSRLASAGLDHTVRVWDVAQGKEVFFPLEHRHWVTSLAYSLDGRRLVSASYDRVVKLWDADTGNLEHELEMPASPVRKVAFSPDHQRLAAACYDQSVAVWDLTTRKIVRTLPATPGLVRSVAFSPDGQLLASVNFDLHTPEIRSLDAPAPLLHAAFGPAGDVAAAAVDGSFLLWDMKKEPAESQTLSGHKGPVRTLAYNQSRRLWATGGEDGEVGLWDGKAAPLFVKASDRWILALAFHPDGRHLAAGAADGSIVVLDLDNLAQPRVLKKHSDSVHALVFSADGKLLVSAGADRALLLWDVASGAVTHTFAGGHDSPIRALALVREPSGTRTLLASAGDDRLVLLWDFDTGKHLRTLTGHSKAIASLSFSPDGKRLASGAEDGAVKLWDVTTGQDTLTLRGHREPVTSVAFSPDGGQLLSAGWDQKIIIWDGGR